MPRLTLLTLIRWVFAPAGMLVLLCLLVRPRLPVQTPICFNLFTQSIPSAFSVMDGIRIEDADLSGADYVGIRFDNARLRNVNLAGARLTGVSLRDAVLEDVDLSRAEFRGCDLRGTKFLRGTLRDASFSRTIYDRATRWPPGPPKRGASLTGPRGSSAAPNSVGSDW